MWKYDVSPITIFSFTNSNGGCYAGCYDRHCWCRYTERCRKQRRSCRSIWSLWLDGVHCEQVDLYLYSLYVSDVCFDSYCCGYSVISPPTRTMYKGETTTLPTLVNVSASPSQPIGGITTDPSTFTTMSTYFHLQLHHLHQCPRICAFNTFWIEPIFILISLTNYLQ